MDTEVTDWTAERVRELRQRLGLTQGQMAARLPCARISISYWETGHMRPTDYRIIRALDALDHEAGRGA